MRAVSRYMFRQLLFAALFITIALTFALWLTQSLRMIDYMVNRGLPASEFLKLILLLLPSFLGVVLPVATVVGVLFVYNKMTQDSEIVVMRASGLSPLQLARPALALAVLSTAAVYALMLYFLPLSFRNFKDMQFDVRQSYANVLIQEGIFNTVGESFTVYVRERDDEGALVGIIVHDTRNRDRPVTVVAELGAIVRTPDGARVLLLNGNRQEVDRRTGQLSLLYFDQYTVDLSSLGGDGNDGRQREPEERYLHELLDPSPDDLKNEKFARELKAELHQRLVSPLYTISFTLIGLTALLTGDFNRRGRPLRLVVAGVAVGALQAYALTAQDLTNRSTDAAVLMYLGPVLPTIAALFLLSRRRRRVRRPQVTMEATA